MHLYKTSKAIVLADQSRYFLLHGDWDALVNRRSLYAYLLSLEETAAKISEQDFQQYLTEVLAPIGTQEVWAAGVTYRRSRDARMEESKDSGGGDFYQKVYDAKRPELFFKALPHRVAGHRQQVNIRKDSEWNVPEPELTLFANQWGQIQAYTIGNDMSSRSIEGENPLYLPQAKTYDKSAALGPCLFVPERPIARESRIRLEIERSGQLVFEGAVQLDRMKREHTDLVDYLFRAMGFATGCFLMTGTGVVPPDDFTLQAQDNVNISIEGIGTLSNFVGII